MNFVSFFSFTLNIWSWQSEKDDLFLPFPTFCTKHLIIKHFSFRKHWVQSWANKKDLSKNNSQQRFCLFKAVPYFTIWWKTRKVHIFWLILIELQKKCGEQIWNFWNSRVKICLRFWGNINICENAKPFCFLSFSLCKKKCNGKIIHEQSHWQVNNISKWVIQM